MAMIGHTDTKKQIDIALKSARHRNMALPHMLFSGAAGCGKTSMAKEIAKLSDADFIPVIPEDMKNIQSVMDLFESLDHSGYSEKGDRTGSIKPTIVFLDEIHRIPMFGQEKIGIAMENYKIETGRANSYYWVPYFTLIGATTIAGELSRPFLNRFKMNFLFQPYSHKESVEIVLMHAKLIGINITKLAAIDIANRGRGVPRIMVSYLERCRDFAFSVDGDCIDSYITKQTFKSMGVDAKGFTNVELTLLKSLYVSEKPVGLENLAIITNESAKTLKNEIEPFLIQQGFMTRSGSGRTITRPGREYLDEQGYVAKRAGKIEISAGYERD